MCLKTSLAYRAQKVVDSSCPEKVYIQEIYFWRCHRALRQASDRLHRIASEGLIRVQRLQLHRRQEQCNASLEVEGDVEIVEQPIRLKWGTYTGQWKLAKDCLESF